MVPNLFPKTQAPYRLAIVGEAPGRDEEAAGEPFVGMSGRFLKALLSRAGIDPKACFIGNVCQTRPPNNEIESFSWDGYEIQDGLRTLEADLKVFQPNLVLLLGNCAVKAAKDWASTHPLKPGKFRNSVHNWRGSCFVPDPGSPIPFKCLPSLHPSYVLRDYTGSPLLSFDLKKARRECEFPELRLPQRSIELDSDPINVIHRIETIRKARKQIAFDIEGYVSGVPCVSVAPSAHSVFIIPLINSWTLEQEASLWYHFARLLADPAVPKILQNSLYDRFVLQYGFQCCTFGVVDDTMLKHWELYCELEKSLGMQASIYTDEPYYKFERKIDDTLTYWRYCCKDSAVTYEINEKLTPQLEREPLSHDHYRLNVELLNPLLYMELRGISYDSATAGRRRAELQKSMFALQHELDSISGHGIHGKSNGELAAILSETMCYKRDSGRVKKGYEETYPLATALLARFDSLDQSERGHLSVLLELHLNLDSPKQVTTYLYEKLKLPLQTNEEGRATADEKALLKLRKHCGKDHQGSPLLPHGHRVCDLAIQIRRLGTREQMLSIHSDPDERIRCGYNIVGTETGRLTCYTSPTGSGYNLQTIPSEDRDLFVADPDHWFFQCDLKGADGWTVGAHCAALGDRTMLDDLYYGVKPAITLCLGLRGQTKYLSPATPRGEILEAAKQVKKEDWDYFACKIGIWGTCYLMGPDTLRANLLEESDGKLDWSRSEAQDFQRLVFLRYQVKRWHDAVSRRLAIKPVIVAASGHRRVFFGRNTEILGKALAHEPQANTTYATNLAAAKLWRDEENRQGNRLRIEPLHQVHDALCGQFPKHDTAWATARIKSYFDNTLTIAGQQIIIPFDGAYGPSWGDTSVGKI